MKILSQDIDEKSNTLRIELEDEIWYDHEGGLAIDTSDDSLIHLMADTGLVRKDNTLSIYFDHEGDMMTHIISYKNIKTIQHNQNDYTFIFTN